MLPIVELLVGARDALHELVVDVGLQVLQVLLEEDREALCGCQTSTWHSKMFTMSSVDHGLGVWL